jgi:dipeptidyl aminopeptidase/acylaminoacyl peptidase
MLIVAGEDDLTVPCEESEKLFVALRRLGRPVELRLYEGEGHVISEWANANAVDVSRRMVEFLAEHLKIH